MGIRRQAQASASSADHLTFESEAEGDRYVARLEALLDKGIVPDDFKERCDAPVNIADLVREYLAAQAVPSSDRTSLNVIVGRIGATRLTSVDYRWAESWIARMKREQHLAPATIRHHVGALARCFDWAERRGIPAVMPNPLRKLPRRYATYTEADAQTVKALGEEVRREVERDRRLHKREEACIRAILTGETPDGRQRPLDLRWQGALECIFELALESAMRMREMYTLSLDQLNLPEKTIFLDRTKNGDKRQVPLTSVAFKAVNVYMSQVKSGKRGMEGFSFPDGKLFPWWSGARSTVLANSSAAAVSARQPK